MKKETDAEKKLREERERKRKLEQYIGLRRSSLKMSRVVVREDEVVTK